MIPSIVKATLRLLLVTAVWFQTPSIEASPTDTWTYTGSLGIARTGHTATLLGDGRVLVVGGYNGSTPLVSAEVYDPVAGTWSGTTPMHNTRPSHTATLLTDGKVLVAGSGTSELYDPSTETWSNPISMRVSRNDSYTATLVPNGKVLVVGGYNAGSGCLATAEVFNPLTNSWSVTGSMATARNGLSATLLKSGNVLVYGGLSTTAINSLVATAELYDPVTGTFSATDSPGTMEGQTATLLDSGNVLVVSDPKKVRLYDAVSGLWDGQPSTNGVNGNGQTTTLIRLGKVLIVGGSPADAGCEVYSPSTGIWTQTVSLKAARGSHTATCLNDGRVLVAGGHGSTTLSSAEIFEPASFVLSISSVNGAVTGIQSPYVPGTTATIQATPHPGYLFTGWTGDAGGADSPLTVLMDGNKTITATFSPDTNDTDDDGWTNYEEIVVYNSDPILWDTDSDGVKDSKDAFPRDPAETLDTDHDGIGDNADLDDDGDGYSDVDELTIHGTNPKRADSDGDGLSDPDELQIHLTNPNVADTDEDGLSDGAEFLTHHTNPKVGDTDCDGFLDGYEVLTGKSPLDILDKPALVAEARTAIEFTFPAALGKTYRIEDSIDLAIWTTVESGIAGNGGQILRFYTTRNIPKRYFRVEEDAP